MTVAVAFLAFLAGTALGGIIVWHEHRETITLLEADLADAQDRIRRLARDESGDGS